MSNEKLEALSACLGEAGRDSRQWSPSHCGDIDIRIDSDGRWHYSGSPIQRPELVKLFASVLRFEEGEYFLLTPVEKLRIQVEDAPFLIADADLLAEGQPEQRVRMTTTLGEVFELDSEHPIKMLGEADETKPYAHVRDGLWGLLSRPCFYRLVEQVETLPDQEDQYGLLSHGLWFRLL